MGALAIVPSAYAFTHRHHIHPFTTITFIACTFYSFTIGGMLLGELLYCTALTLCLAGTVFIAGFLFLDRRTPLFVLSLLLIQLLLITLKLDDSIDASWANVIAYWLILTTLITLLNLILIVYLLLLHCTSSPTSPSTTLLILTVLL